MSTKTRTRTSYKFVTAEHPKRGVLWAAIDAATVQVEGQIAERRFAAFLTPFRSREAAETALVAAGGTVDRG